ncbi:MAG: HPr family phosphocarrier protein [Deltaproteobacteria bacterium]|nr:HPr family phosphocarrier protein [Deltaproteobacteria bacterium]
MENRRTQTLQRELLITNELGLHARCAAKIAQAAQKASGRVLLSHNGTEVDATSTLDILTLACTKGSSILLTVSDPADAPVMEEISSLVAEGFGETEAP